MKILVAPIAIRCALALLMGAPLSSFAMAQPIGEGPIGPEFESVLGVARLDSDCFGREPCAVPMIPANQLADELNQSRWEIVNGQTFVAQYREALARYLIEQKVRPSIDERFSREELGRAEVALNILDGYWQCLGREILAANARSLADADEATLLSVSAKRTCAEHRVRAMKRLGHVGPDFGDFDLVRDGGAAGAGTAEMLHNLQEFAIAYYTGLRGYRHRRAIELVTVPKPERK